MVSLLRSHLAVPGRDRARRAVARARRHAIERLSAADAAPARGGQPAAGLPRAGGGGAARPGRPAGARSAGTLRLRAAGDLLPADAARALRGARSHGAGDARGRSRRPCRRSRARCSTSSRTWRRWPRASSTDTALAMARGNWPWGDAVLAALGLDQAGKKPRAGRRPRCLEEPAAMGGAAARAAARPAIRSSRARRACGWPRWSRPDPTWPRRGRRRATTPPPPRQAFAPREREDKPNVVLAEAGTGVGKTLGYVAPASLWAEKNGAPVWIATYTRNLQRQIDGELDRLHRDSAEKRRQRGDPQGPRELSLPAELPGGGAAHRPRARERRRPRPAGALGAGQPRRRHDGRRPAGLAARPARPRPHHAAGRPARRMHLFRLPALPPLLRRTHHPPRPPGRHRDRQPRAGDDPGGDGRARRRHAAAALRVRRGPSPVRRRRRRLRRASERHRGLRAAALAARRRGTPRQPRARAASGASATCWATTSRRRRRCAACSTSPSNCPRPTGRRGWPTARCWARPRTSWPWCASRCAPAPRATTRASARNATCGRSIPACSRPPTGSARRSSRCCAPVRRAAPGAAHQARDRGRQARLRPARPHRGRGALARQPLRADARGLARHAARPAQRAPTRPSSTGSRSSAVQAARSTSACTATGSIPTEPFVNARDQAGARRGHHLGHPARFAGRAGRRQRRAAASLADWGRGAHRRAPSAGAGDARRHGLALRLRRRHRAC